MNDVTISAVTWQAAEYKEVWELREEVLRKPIGLSLKNEDLGMDAEDTIFIAIHDGKVIGCLMLHHLDTHTLKLRQMAVYDAWQGKNIGRILVEAAEKFAQEKGYSIISLHARLVAEGFYKRLGYQAFGGIFTEVGIEHVVMKKQI